MKRSIDSLWICVTIAREPINSFVLLGCLKKVKCSCWKNEGMTERFLLPFQRHYLLTPLKRVPERCLIECLWAFLQLSNGITTEYLFQDFKSYLCFSCVNWHFTFKMYSVWLISCPWSVVAGWRRLPGQQRETDMTLCAEGPSHDFGRARVATGRRLPVRQMSERNQISETCQFQDLIFIDRLRKPTNFWCLTSFLISVWHFIAHWAGFHSTFD